MNKEKILKALRVAFLSGAAFLAHQADAAQITWYGFNVLQPNAASSTATLQAQAFMGVSAGTSGGVNFYFENVGPNALAIDDIYFQDPPPALLPPNPITTWSSGVAFSIDNTANPQDPHGGISWTGTQWIADSDSGNPGVMLNGVNPNEWINFYFSGAVLGDVISALDAGTWHTAIHAQNIYPTGGSEWAQSSGPGTGDSPGVPDGGLTVALLGFAVAGIGMARRKFGV
jgi:hypothetical protein